MQKSFPRYKEFWAEVDAQKHSDGMRALSGGCPQQSAEMRNLRSLQDIANALWAFSVKNLAPRVLDQSIGGCQTRQLG